VTGVPRAAVAWSSLDGAACIRVRGGAAGADVRVRPAAAAVRGDLSRLPPMAGQLVADGPDLCFVPRFGFADGTGYVVTVDDVPAGVLHSPRRARPATAAVLAIRPSAAVVPRNLLRCYVWFSAPMSTGSAAGQIRLVGDDGMALDDALLEHDELWDADRRRLTVLLDPARIKRGLAGHGYALAQGRAFRLEVGTGLRDAAGAPLRAGARRRYRTGPDERRRVEPGGWELAVPAAGGRGSLTVTFDRPMDHGLLRRCLRVTGPGGAPADGVAGPGPQQRSWRLVPRRPWAAGSYLLVIDPALEDLAGNSVDRVFDRDLADAADDPRPPGPVLVPFEVC
jgi:hypothetical protein